jgi:hypothetical protein
VRGLRALPNTEELLAAINSTDHLAMVIRAHQCIEVALDVLISESLPFRHDKLVRGIPFLLKLDLAIGLLILELEERPALMVINKIRNKCAHELTDGISKQEVDDLFNALSKRTRASIGKYEDNPDSSCRFRAASLAVFTCLEANIGRVRDKKLWEQATHEIIDETVARTKELTERYLKDRGGESESGQKIRERFDELKANQGLQP